MELTSIDPAEPAWIVAPCCTLAGLIRYQALRGDLDLVLDGHDPCRWLAFILGLGSRAHANATVSDQSRSLEISIKWAEEIQADVYCTDIWMSTAQSGE